jgi:hypothetical protein
MVVVTIVVAMVVVTMVVAMAVITKGKSNLEVTLREDGPSAGDVVAVQMWRLRCVCVFVFVLL